jgi:hypothetical protein
VVRARPSLTGDVAAPVVVRPIPVASSGTEVTDADVVCCMSPPQHSRPIDAAVARGRVRPALSGRGTVASVARQVVAAQRYWRPGRGIRSWASFGGHGDSLATNRYDVDNPRRRGLAKRARGAAPFGDGDGADRQYALSARGRARGARRSTRSL